MRKFFLPLCLVMAAVIGHIAPTAAQVGAAITRTQTVATISAIERQVREAAQQDRQKQAQPGPEQTAAAPQTGTAARRQ